LSVLTVYSGRRGRQPAHAEANRGEVGATVDAAARYERADSGPRTGRIPCARVARRWSGGLTCGHATQYRSA
jgi:hypothetical protein